MTRVVSLLPSATEIVCALGQSSALVGRSHECDHPPGVTALPVCSEAQIDTRGDSASIDRAVKARLRQALSIYELRLDTLQTLAPDVIITQTQCEVCAVSPEDVHRALADWLAARPALVALEPAGLEGLWADVRRIAAALDVPGEGEALVARLQARMDEIAAQARALGPTPRVACIEWIDPLMAAGNWVPELVRRAGGEDALGTVDDHSAWIDWEQVRTADPDVIVVMPCGFDLARTRAESAHLRALPGWEALRAVREGRVVVTDGHQYFNRPGPRLVDSLEMLAEVLHPGAFRFGHEGRGWERLAA